MDDQQNEDKVLFIENPIDPVIEQEKQIKEKIMQMRLKILECPLVARVDVTFTDELEEYYGE